MYRIRWVQSRKISRDTNESKKKMVAIYISDFVLYAYENSLLK